MKQQFFLLAFLAALAPRADAQSCTATASKNITILPAPTASIAASPANGLLPCGGGVSLFTPAGTGYLYQWRKNNVAIAGATGSTYLATTTGQYTVVATAQSTGCATTSATFTVWPNYACNPLFCASSGNSSAEWIEAFGIANTSNASGNNGGYGNFLTAVAPTTLTKGVTYTLTFSPGYAGTEYTERWRVWIDYNHDGDFADSGEAVKSVSGKNTLTATFKVPTTKPNGATRLRVSMKRTAYPAPCGAVANGEVEDYVVIIGQPANLQDGGAERSDFTEDFSMQIAPNPADRTLALTFSEESTTDEKVLIFNVLGELVRQDLRPAGAQTLTLETADWPPGIYWLQVGQRPANRVVVQH